MDGLLGHILGDLYVRRGIQQMIVEGPADVFGGINTNWSKIFIRMSNDDALIATNGLEYPRLKRCDVQLSFSSSHLSPDCTFQVTNSKRDTVRYLSWHPLADYTKWFNVIIILHIFVGKEDF
jgi:hypothetical protein